MDKHRLCYVCPEPVEHDKPVNDPGDWLCVEHARDERELASYAGEAGMCPWCDTGSFDEPGRLCALHAAGDEMSKVVCEECDGSGEVDGENINNECTACGGYGTIDTPALPAPRDLDFCRSDPDAPRLDASKLFPLRGKL